MKKIVWLVLIVMVGIVLSPYYALYQIKLAYEKGDYHRVVSFVDLPMVQNAIKTQLNTRLDETVNQGVVSQLLEWLPSDGVDKLIVKAKNNIDEVVISALTADNLTKTLAGDMTDESKKMVAIWAMVSGYVDYPKLVQDMLLTDQETALKNQQAVAQERIMARFGGVSSADTKMHYCGVHCFEVVGSASGVPVVATFRRVGVVGWRMVDIKLP